MTISKKESKADLGVILSQFKELSQEDKVVLVSYLINELKRLHNLSEKEIVGDLLKYKKPIQNEFVIPVGVFDNDALSSLEAIVKYMREDLKLRFIKIAKLLNRSNKTIWTTYHNAIKKYPSAFGVVSSKIMIPVSSISDRSFSTLESVVGFIKDLDYTNHETAVMLRLDDRTIWSVYDRVKKKRGTKIDTK